MLSLKRSKKIFLSIYDNPQLCEKIEANITRHSAKFKLYVALCRLGRWEWFLKCDPMTKLCLVYAYLPIVRDKYIEQKIDDKIFYDTMSDIKIWIIDHKNRTNEDGLYELNWIMLHMTMSIFKLGRLQFQKWFYYDKTPCTINNTSYKFGDKVLNIHIPRGEKLKISDCLDSLQQAKAFFKKHYPKYANGKFVCHSWLLYSGNKNYMDSSSNIIKFSNLFKTVSEHEAPSQAILWLFGIKLSNDQMLKNKAKNGKYLDTSKLDCTTILQQNAINYIDNGGTLGDAFCVLK